MDVRNLLPTSPGHPAQWEGNTADGRPVHVQYRRGHLTVVVGEPGETVWDAASRGTELLSERIGTPEDGELLEALLRERLAALEIPPRTIELRAGELELPGGGE